MNSWTHVSIAAAMMISFACDAPEGAQPTTAKAELALVDGCVTSREKAAECRMTLVDRWIAIRAKYNPDLAEERSTPDKAKALREMALAEFEKDGTGPRAPRVAACRQMMGHMPPAALRLGEAFSACTGKKSCDAYAECALPLFEKMEIMRTQGPRR